MSSDWFLWCAALQLNSITLVLIDIVVLQNSDIVAFASLYCKLYEYSLFILKGGRWKYDRKIRDIDLTMVSLWPPHWKLLCLTHIQGHDQSKVYKNKKVPRIPSFSL